MIIRSASFVTSSAKISQLPAPDRPEFAFIGRSNVGKSSLINMLVSRKGLAKISGSPGKTQTINHFIINDSWYLVDLPGYGYARVSRKMREQWEKLFTSYITMRENLILLFVLVDARHEPMAVDLAFMEKLALNGIPFARVFTKSDKLSAAVAEKNREIHNSTMLRTWESLPPTFITSAARGTGKEELLDYIENNMIFFKNGK
ncbi:MAG TPA: ribosome biogenesis GTP-binding protein YihA/YsxC [Bacteroidales bacterium]|nr:ribosome biogenesis GTP-binding protein YihA/YsxC [Bacteroidales bacterium]HPQ63087.1 ribosome biogenesis GTP-binding protein YihA/YsxC [Bacteroidales bacterium]HRW26446.1 ribosome biogenesis GTP-binding protein YihA/YsxC [Bacteroidales bacterium]